MITNDWKDILNEEFEKPYFKLLAEFVETAYNTHTCFPPRNQIFNAFLLCPFQEVKVVILGQDPYHEAGQAMGLSFSVPMGVKFPPSLRNIFRELMDDTHCAPPFGGDLTAWAKQGVLLLNATLTVEESKAGSHAKRGWETFTDAVIQKISDKKEHVVFILWGNYAQQKRTLIDTNKHLILESVHPSPLSAHHGFFGNHHFTQTNNFLTNHHLTPINWEL